MAPTHPYCPAITAPGSTARSGLAIRESVQGSRQSIPHCFRGGFDFLAVRDADTSLYVDIRRAQQKDAGLDSDTRPEACPRATPLTEEQKIAHMKRIFGLYT